LSSLDLLLFYSKISSTEIKNPLVVSATKLIPYPGEFPALAPLQKSLYTHTSGI